MSAQFNCPDGLIYGTVLNDPYLRVYDPAKPPSSTNPSNIAVPNNQLMWPGGLALMPNINGGSPSPTFYSTLSNFHVCYWNGSVWVDTGHLANTNTTTTLGTYVSGCASALFNIIWGPLVPQPVAEIYKYTGNGNATLLFTVPQDDFVYDLVNDCQCNLYLIGPKELRKYSPNGVLLTSIPVTGIPGLGSGLNEFTIIGDDIFVASSNNMPLFHGKLNATLISFSAIQTSWPYKIPSQLGMASCPFSTLTTVSASISTATLGCVPSAVQLTAGAALTQASYNWSGPSIIPPATGTQVAVNLPGIYNCTVTQTGCDYILANLVTTVASNSTTVVPIINPSVSLCYEPNIILKSVLSSTLYTNYWSSSTSTSAGNNYSVSGPGIYTLHTTNVTNGCSGISTTSILPTPNTALGLNSNTMCVFSNNGKDQILLYPSGGNSYTIVTPQGFTTQISSSQPIVLQQLSPPYGKMGAAETVTLLGSNGVCSTSSTANFTLLPLNTFTISPASTITCINKDQTLFGNGAQSYQWNPHANVTALNESMFKIKTETSTIFEVSAWDNFGCLLPPVSVTVSTFPKITGQFTALDKNICVPVSLHLKFEADQPFKGSTIWTVNKSTFFSSQFTYPFQFAGEYIFSGTITDSMTQCSNTLEFAVQTYPKPRFEMNYSPTTPVELIDEVIFTAKPLDSFENNFDWFITNNVKVTGENSGTIFESAGMKPVALVVTNEYNCVDTLITTVKVNPLDFLYIPNAFTPNQDGLNDVFLPAAQEVLNYSMTIYDRWGHLVFKSTDVNLGWDGTFDGRPCPNGEYTWKIFVTKSDNSHTNKVGAVFLNR